MSNIMVRDVPEVVHAKLQQRAREQGQSLQQYLSAQLARLAETVTLDELLDRIASRKGGRVGLGQAIDDLAAERGNR